MTQLSFRKITFRDQFVGLASGFLLLAAFAFAGHFFGNNGLAGTPPVNDKSIYYKAYQSNDIGAMAKIALTRSLDRDTEIVLAYKIDNRCGDLVRLFEGNAEVYQINLGELKQWPNGKFLQSTFSDSTMKTTCDLLNKLGTENAHKDDTNKFILVYSSDIQSKLKSAGYVPDFLGLGKRP
jgi:hypothetical protein